MYKLTPLDIITNTQTTVQRNADSAFIPLHSDNTDYQQFVRDIKNGVVLNDAEGNPITGTDLVTFLNSLP
jgi:hypothetical protein